MRAKEAAKLEGPPTRSERVKYIRRVVGDPESVAKRMLLVLNALDRQCQPQAVSAGLKVDNLTVAHVGRVIAVFQHAIC